MKAEIGLIQGDITTVKVDAVVNAANNSLLGGGGVDGAIHAAGGPAILQECLDIRARQGGCDTGQAVITTAGKLPARYVIHTVGPVWHGGAHDEACLLHECYINSLNLACQHKCTSIAFPNISTGVYRFPRTQAARIAVDSVKEFLQNDGVLERVLFVCFDIANYELYRKLLSV